MQADMLLKQAGTDLASMEICRIAPVDPNAPVLRVTVNKRVAEICFELDTETADEVTIIVQPKRVGG